MADPTDGASRRAELGRFLKARRARVSPEAAGLMWYAGRRRVPGLRREELAQLAGVSVDYYVRLEQGRGGNVSRTVLDAIADVLSLDEAERAYVHDLARPLRRRGTRSPRTQRVNPAGSLMLAAMSDVPAYVFGYRTDLLAWNRLAAALFVDFGELPPAERNWARLTFLDPAMRDLFTDWPAKARDTVAYLRFSAGRHPDDPTLTELVDDLAARSNEFRRLWAEHRVHDKIAGTKTLYHPMVGRLTLASSAWRAADDPDQTLVAYVAANPETQASLQVLAGLTHHPSATGDIVGGASVPYREQGRREHAGRVTNDSGQGQ